MKVRKFFAPSSREALKLVREALGADAVVLSNRVVDGGVELVAVTDESLSDIVETPGQALPPADVSGLRDRTVALPGVLAAGRMGDTPSLASSGMSATQPAPAVAARPAHLAMYDAVSTDDSDMDDMNDMGAPMSWRADDIDADAGVALSGMAAAASKPVPKMATAGVAESAPIAAPSSVSHVAAGSIAPAVGVPGTLRSADIARERFMPEQPVVAETTAPAARSMFSRMFTRPSFRDRVDEAESAVPGLRRPEKQDDGMEDASVLGLTRAEQRTHADATPAAHSAARAPAPMTASMASAKGMGNAGAPIVVRPAMSDDESMYVRQPAAFAPLPAFPEARVALPIEMAEAVEAAKAAEAADAAEAGEATAHDLPAFDARDLQEVAESTSEATLEASVAADAAVNSAESSAASVASLAPATVVAETVPEVATALVNASRFAPVSYTAQTRFKHAAHVPTAVSAVPFIGTTAAASRVTADVAPVAPLAPLALVEAVAAAVEPEASALSVPSFDFAIDEIPAIDLSSYEVLGEQTASVAVAQSAMTDVVASPDTRGMADQVLTEMRTLCSTLGAQLEAIGQGEREKRDPVRIAMTRTLLSCGFSIQLVRLLLAKMPSVSNTDEGMNWVRATFERNLPVLDNEDQLMEQGGVFALMGPTGVGKTTTTAKLAARAVMRHGADRVALLTTDSYRIGAHEQLRIYGRILGVAVHAVKDAADLSLVLSELRNKHMVLIDTIGMSQRDRAVSEQVSMLCRTHLPVKRLLLLNATSHGDTLNEVVRAYGAHGEKEGEPLSGCIITKMDEANGIGAALDTVMRHRLPVHYVSNGQKVPEDLRVARRGFLIESAFKDRPQTSPYHPEEADLEAMFPSVASVVPSIQQSNAGEVQFG